MTRVPLMQQQPRCFFETEIFFFQHLFPEGCRCKSRYGRVRYEQQSVHVHHPRKKQARGDKEKPEDLTD